MNLNKVLMCAIAAISTAQLGAMTFTDTRFISNISPSQIKAFVDQLTKGDPILTSVVMARISQAQDKDVEYVQYSPQKVRALIDQIKETDYEGGPVQVIGQIKEIRGQRAKIATKINKIKAKKNKKTIADMLELSDLQQQDNELRTTQAAFQALLDKLVPITTQSATDILAAGKIVDKLTDKNLAIAVKARINEALDQNALSKNKIVYPLRNLTGLVDKVAKEQPQQISPALLELEDKLYAVQAGIEDYFRSYHARDTSARTDKTAVGNEWWDVLASARNNRSLQERLEQFYDSVLNTYGATIIDQLLWPVKDHFRNQLT